MAQRRATLMDHLGQRELHRLRERPQPVAFPARQLTDQVVLLQGQGRLSRG